MSTNTPNCPRPWFDLVLWILVIIGVVLTMAVYRYCLQYLIPTLIIGVILCIGFGLPRWIERRAAIQRAEQAKTRELQKWGFWSRDREGPWINYIDYPLVKKTAIADGKRFYSEWLIVHEGEIIVNPGKSSVNLSSATVHYNYGKNNTYAWDGCSPKAWFLWLTLCGVPDWKRRLSEVLTLRPNGTVYKKIVFWQKAHHASLVHDALYQYLHRIPIAKAKVDRLFYQMLIDSGFTPWTATFYFWGVRLFGGGNVQRNGPAENSRLRLKKSRFFL